MPNSAPTGATRIPLNVLFGVPDDGKGVIRVAPDGRSLIPVRSREEAKNYRLRGSANIEPFLSRHRFAIRPLFLQQGIGIQLKLGPGAILNHVADADICSEALELAAQVAKQIERPCFNHPTAIAKTTRDGVSRLLRGIPGLIVPKTIRVHAESPASIGEAAADAELRYPVLVRVVGSHGGDNMVRIDSPDAMGEIAQLKRDGHALYVTEFYDFVSRDGHYRKSRIVVVGDDIFIRHCVIGDHWALHGGDRSAGAEEEERALFESFPSKWAPRLKTVFCEIARRFRLDYFGVDCNVDPEGQVVLFEANACMKVLKNYRPSPNRFDAPIALIKDALENRLASPETWRYSHSTSQEPSPSVAHHG